MPFELSQATFSGIVKRKKRPLLLAAGLAALFFLAACSPHSPADPDKDPPTPVTTTAITRPTGGSTLHLDRGLPGSPDERLTVALADPDSWNLNPFRDGDRLFPVDPRGYYQPLYQTLIQYDPARMDYVPVLAETVRYEEGVLSILLAGDGQWHDGFPLTSADILFSIQANQKFETSAGQVLDDLVKDMDTDEFSLDIHLSDEKDNAGLRCMEALAHLLILPEHHWNAIVSATATEEQLADQKLPLVGSGPWSLWGEDEFALSFVRSSGAAEDSGQPAYLSILKYADAHLAKQAFLRHDAGLMLGAVSSGLISGLETEGTRDGSLVILGGERLAGITVNPSGGALLGNRSFRSLLSLVSDQPHAQTIPSTISQLNGDKVAAQLLQADEGTISRLAGEAGLIREHGVFFMKEGQDLPLISLIFPDGQAEAEESCEAFAESARELGIPIALKGVSLSDWKQAYESGDYALIYTESCPDESIISLVSRLEKIPGLTSHQANGIAVEFDGEAGYAIMASVEDAYLSGDLKANTGNLISWAISESVFLPLTTEILRGGLINQTETALDLSSLFAVKTRTEPVGFQP